MKRFFLVLTLLIGAGQCAYSQLGKKLADKAKEVTGTSNSSSSGLSKDEVIAGLKEALTKGAESSSGKAGLTDGFNKNALIRIPYPPEAKKMRDKLVAIGMEKKVDEFELSMNRAAESAAKEAYPIFAQAVKNMTVSDGFAILNGADTAATHYLRTATTAELTSTFGPIVKKAMDEVQVTAYWTPLVTTYNKIPGVQKQNPDLEAYVTSKAIDGLMKLIAQEEQKIRKDPAAQVTDLLKKVFGGR